MKVRLKSVRGLSFPLVFGLLLGATALGSAQTAKPAQSYPAHLPYSFGNFVWWSDEELRTLLKKRIPGLGDEIATTTAAEGRVRDALTALLKEKGIQAEVQSAEPSLSSFRPLMENMVGMGDLEIPPFQPSIVFSVLRPEVVLGRVTVQSDAEDAMEAISAEFNGDEGKEFAAGMVSFSRSRAEEILKRKGYLGEQVLFQRMPPYKRAESYAADLTIVVTAGPKYRISALKVDGGPLFEGRDLMQVVQTKVGDPAGGSPFRDLGPALRAYYEQQGFADVRLKVDQVLDKEHAAVAYSLNVVPGPVYHLRSLTVENLNSEQEKRVRDLLGMKPGDVYLDKAINDLYHEIANEPSLKGYSFSFGPKADKAAAMIDLSLSFFKEGGESSVTIK
ncbi:MAG TPA: hypothetical protein VN776_15515 [Terracidiphilus sp.]|nr:hypothetical protein [Terracidiphilus sp.]